MKYETKAQAESEARQLNDQAKSKWFCPFRNDKCYGVGYIAFQAVEVEETFRGKFKLDSDIPGCRLSSLEEMPESNTFSSSSKFASAALMGAAVNMSMNS